MGLIYFIQCREDGPVKIGYAGRDPEKRLAALQTGSPDELHLRFVVQGTEQTERAIHASLSDQRIRGEWFRGSTDFLDRVGVAIERSRIVPRRIEEAAKPRTPRWLQSLVDARARTAAIPIEARTKRRGRPTRIVGILGELIEEVGGVIELAKILGVDRRTVLRWHRGERSPGGPVKAFLRELAEPPSGRGSIHADGAR